MFGSSGGGGGGGSAYEGAEDYSSEALSTTVNANHNYGSFGAFPFGPQRDSSRDLLYIVGAVALVLVVAFLKR